jgi:hypothetical protein
MPRRPGRRPLAALVGLLLLAGCRAAPPPVPPAPALAPAPGAPAPGATMLPADLRIIAPGADVPPARASFSGRWLGRFPDPAGAHVLIVEAMAAQGATVVLTLPQSGAAPWLRARARFEEDALVADTPRGTFRYTLQPDGSALAVWERDGRREQARLVRQPWHP